MCLWCEDQYVRYTVHTSSYVCCMDMVSDIFWNCIPRVLTSNYPKELSISRALGVGWIIVLFGHNYVLGIGAGHPKTFSHRRWCGKEIKVANAKRLKYSYSMFNEHSYMQSFPILSLSSAISTTAGEGTSICCLKPSWIRTHHIYAAFRIPSACLAANVKAFHHCWIENSFSSPAGRPRPYSPFEYTISRDPKLLSFAFHCHALSYFDFHHSIALFLFCIFNVNFPQRDGGIWGSIPQKLLILHQHITRDAWRCACKCDGKLSDLLFCFQSSQITKITNMFMHFWDIWVRAPQVSSKRMWMCLLHEPNSNPLPNKHN